MTVEDGKVLDVVRFCNAHDRYIKGPDEPPATFFYYHPADPPTEGAHSRFGAPFYDPDAEVVLKDSWALPHNYQRWPIEEEAAYLQCLLGGFPVGSVRSFSATGVKPGPLILDVRVITAPAETGTLVASRDITVFLIGLLHEPRIGAQFHWRSWDPELLTVSATMVVFDSLHLYYSQGLTFSFDSIGDFSGECHSNETILWPLNGISPIYDNPTFFDCSQMIIAIGWVHPPPVGPP